MREGISIFLLSLFPVCTLQAQGILDRVVLGDEQSEKAHGFVTYCPSYVSTVEGLMGESARACLRYPDNPYAGKYKGIYGGEYQVVLKVDGTAQNYLTTRYCGNDTGFEIHYTADVDGKQLSNVGSSLVQYSTTPKAPGAFLYRTYAIPRSETDGKSEVVVRIRSKGRYYQYGKPGQFETYQRVLDQDMPPLYALYTHTNPSIDVPEDEAQGHIIAYSEAPVKTGVEKDLSRLKATAIEKETEQLSKILSNTSYNNKTAGSILLLAAAYSMPQYPVAYKSSVVVEKIKWALDNMVSRHYDGSITANSEWGGAFGYHGYAIYKMRGELGDEWLDERVDLGNGIKTRREQLIELIKLSFNHGATDRRMLSNQVAWATTPVYGASLGLYALDSVRFAEYPKIGLRIVREAAGLEEFTNSVTGLEQEQPKLGDSSDVNGRCGAHYRMITSKGGGHEFPGWVCPGCYGYLWQNFIEMWDMMRHDPYLRGKDGFDTDFLARIADYERLNAALSYPSVDANGNRAMLCHSVTCSRIIREPGYVYYGDVTVAGLTGDHELLGHAWQAYEDGQHTWATPAVDRVYGLYTPQSIDTLMAHMDSREKLAFTSGEPDTIVSDEENAMVAFSHDGEIYYVSFAANMAQHISGKYTVATGFVPDRTEFYPSGVTSTVQTEPYNSAHRVKFPEHPLLAGCGTVVQLPSYCHQSGVYSDRQPYMDFYQLWYDKYLIGMNTGLYDDASYDIVVPESLKGKTVYNLTTRQNVTLSDRLSVPSGTTYILFVGKAQPEAGYVAEESPANVAVLSERVDELTAFLHQIGDSVSLSGTNIIGHYPHDKFTDFWREVAIAGYAVNSGTMSQHRVDSILSSLNTAYENLIVSCYRGKGIVTVPGGIHFDKAMKQGGQFSLSGEGTAVSSAQNGAYWMIPVKAEKAGVYTFTAKISTMCTSSESPTVNLTLLDPQTYNEDSGNDVLGNRSLLKGKLPDEYYTYTWDAYMDEGETKILKLSVSGKVYYVSVAQISQLSVTLRDFSAEDYSWLFQIPADNEDMQSAFKKQFLGQDDKSPWSFMVYDTQNGTYSPFARVDDESPKNMGIDTWYNRDEWLFINSEGYVHPLVEASPAVVFTAPSDGMYNAMTTVQRQEHKVDNNLYCRYRFLKGGLENSISVPKEDFMFELPYGYKDNNVPASINFYVNMKAGDAMTFEVEAYTANRISSGGTTWLKLVVSRVPDDMVTQLRQTSAGDIYDVYEADDVCELKAGDIPNQFELRIVKNGVWISACKCLDAEIYSISGNKIMNVSINSIPLFVRLLKGIYLVKVKNGSVARFHI